MSIETELPPTNNIYENRNSDISRVLQSNTAIQFLVGGERFIIHTDTPIGGGDLSVVFSAQLPESNHLKIAAKVFDPLIKLSTKKTNEDLEAIFDKEYRLLNTHVHPGIPKLYGQGKIEINDMQIPVLFREYFENTLESELERFNSKFDINMAINMADQISSALDYLNKDDYIVTDLSTKQIMDRPNGTWAIGDLNFVGNGEIYETGIDSTTVSPEYEIQRLNDGKLTPNEQGQVYALGLVVYKSLGGKLKDPDFRITDPESVIEDRGTIPTEILEILKKATNIDPEQRYNTTVEFSNVLKDYKHKIS